MIVVVRFLINSAPYSYDVGNLGSAIVFIEDGPFWSAAVISRSVCIHGCACVCCVYKEDADKDYICCCSLSDVADMHLFAPN